MNKIDLSLVQALRQRTGLGMMDCKNALVEANGDIEKAVEILRKKGAAVAAKRGERTASEGIVQTYIHPGSRLGVLLELNCETDFVARTDDFKNLANDICMHIAAMKPLYVSPDQVDPKFLEHERSVIKEQLATSGKPEKVIDQIAEGKIQKLYGDICLLNQNFIKNDQQTIKDLIETVVARTGEKVSIKRFCRFEVGA